MLLGNSSCKGFLEELFVAISKGGFVGGICIRVFVSVAFKVLARFYRRI
jgi:hypothetical protein